MSYHPSKYYSSYKSSFSQKFNVINLEEDDNIIEIDSPLTLTPEKSVAKKEKILKQEIIILDSDDEKDVEVSMVQIQQAQEKEKEVNMIFGNLAQEEIEYEKTSTEETPIKRKNTSNLFDQMTTCNKTSFEEKLKVEREKSRFMLDTIYLSILSGSNKKSKE